MLGEALYTLRVERGIDLVKEDERRRFRLVEGQGEADRDKSLLATTKGLEPRPFAVW